MLILLTSTLRKQIISIIFFLLVFVIFYRKLTPTTMVGYIQKILKKKWNNKKVILRTSCHLNKLNNNYQYYKKVISRWTFIHFTIFREEIEFMLQCCESNHDGKIDYIGFTDQFHEPSKEIGFNLAVLLTNLSEHMPNEPR